MHASILTLNKTDRYSRILTCLFLGKENRSIELQSIIIPLLSGMTEDNCFRRKNCLQWGEQTAFWFDSWSEKERSMLCLELVMEHCF
jgi:hypothetical protein